MKALITLSFSIMLSWVSCVKEDPDIIKNSDGVVTYKKPLWRTSMTDNGWITSAFSGTILINNTQYYQASLSDGNGYISLLDYKGNILYSTIYSESKTYKVRRKPYIYENIQYCDMGKNIITLNPNEEKYTLLDTPLDNCTFLGGINNEIFITNFTWGDVIDPVIYNLDNNTSKQDGFIDYFIKKDRHIDEIEAFANKYLLITTKNREPTTPGVIRDYFVSIYDYQNKMFIIEEVEVDGLSRQPVLGEGLIYFEIDQMVWAISIDNKNIEWKTTKKTQDYYAGYYYNGVVVYSNFDDYIYGYHAETGQELWKISGSGNGTKQFKELNGILYYRNGGNATLEALDPLEGKLVWQIECPDTKFDRGAFFKDEIVVIPGNNGEKGKIIAPAYLATFGYEAER